MFCHLGKTGADPSQSNNDRKQIDGPRGRVGKEEGEPGWGSCLQPVARAPVQGMMNELISSRTC